MKLLHTAHVPAGDAPLPTIVALHGWGASAHDLLGLAPILHGGKAIVLCPQGPVAMDIGQGMLGYGWFPLGQGRELDPEEFRRGADAVGEFLDEAQQRYPIDPARTLLLGFSQGGVMAYDRFLREPGRFAGLAALSSWLPAELCADIPATEAHTGKPVLVLHGSEDPMIPVDRARDSRDRLLDYRVDLTLREFEMGHEINPDALRTLIAWLEEKALNPLLG